MKDQIFLNAKISSRTSPLIQKHVNEKGKRRDTKEGSTTSNTVEWEGEAREPRYSEENFADPKRTSKRRCATYIHWNITQPYKEWNNAICSNMDGPRDYHTKWSKSERERQIPYDTTYMWNLKYDTNELIYETETDSDIEDRRVVAKGEDGWGREGLGVWD